MRPCASPPGWRSASGSAPSLAASAVSWPRDGRSFGFSVAWLAGTPFHNSLLPGIVLLVVIGVWPLIAGVLTLRGSPHARWLAAAIGVPLVVWILVEMVVLAGVASLLRAFCLPLGGALVAQARRSLRAGPWSCSKVTHVATGTRAQILRSASG